LAQAQLYALFSYFHRLHRLTFDAGSCICDSMAASLVLVRSHGTWGPALQDLSGGPAYNLLYNMTGYGYVLAWGISFYPQLMLNWRRKSTAGMSIGFLWYNLLGFTLYLVYTCFAPDAAVQDTMFAGHALFITALTLAQVPLYGTNKLSDFPQVHGKIAAALLVALDICLVLNVGQWMPIMTLIFACGYLKTVISLVKYTPQFYLNFQRKSTMGFAMGMVFLDLVGGVLSIFQQFVSCSYDASTGNLRDEWTWQPVIGNKPKLFLGLIAIFYDLAFMYQHFVMYPTPTADKVSLPEAATSSPVRKDTLGDATPCNKAKTTEASDDLDSLRPLLAKEEPIDSDSCPSCGTDYAPMAAACRRCEKPRVAQASASTTDMQMQREFSGESESVL